MVLIDTNILIYSHSLDSPFNDAAKQKLIRLNDDGQILCVSNQILREYMAVVSRLLLTDLKDDLSSLQDDVRLFNSQYVVLEETSDTRQGLLRLLGQFRVGGKQVHDANLVATMLHYGIGQLLTHNVDDFKRFGSVIEILPLLDEAN